MPRVEIKKKEYKVLDLKRWVKGQIAMSELRQEDVAKALGITQSALSVRLKVPKNGKWVTESGQKIQKDPFSYGDILTLCDLFGASNEDKQRLLTL